VSETAERYLSGDVCWLNDPLGSKLHHYLNKKLQCVICSKTALCDVERVWMGTETPSSRFVSRDGAASGCLIVWER
jgi:hypothetical protein